MATHSNPRGYASLFTYDELGRLIRDENPAGGFIELDRVDDTMGYTVTKTTALGRVTSYRIEDLPTGEERSYKEWPDGTWNEVLLGTDGSNKITYYDGTVVTLVHGPDPRFGMLAPVVQSVSITLPGGLTNVITQSRVANLTNPDDVLSLQSIQDTTTINGRTYTYEYDAATRSYTSTSPEGHQTVSVNDTLGRMTSVNLAAGVDDIGMSYDAQGRITQAVQGAQWWKHAYDALNRIISITDAASNETLYSYDNGDRIVQMTLPGGETIRYSYDSNGNFTRLTMPSSDIHTLGYTPLDFLVNYKPPGNPSFSRSYDLDRALVSYTLPGGRIVANTFDGTTGQWTDITYPEAVVEFAYEDSCCDRLASLTRTPTGVGTAQDVSYSYDGGLVTGATWSGVAVGDYQYSYDNNFFLTNITFSSGSDNVSTPFSYDADGMPTDYGPFTLKRGGPGGALSQIRDSNLTMAIGYDSIARVQRRSQTINGSSIYDFALTRNNVGLIVQKVETVDGVSYTYDYTYDSNGRLTDVTRNGIHVESYTYDANSNRLSTLTASATYDTQDRLISHDGVSYTFDVDGYLTQRGTDTFQYSSRGELISVIIGSTTTISYSYDGLGRRIGRTDDSGTYQYLYGLPGNPYLITATRDQNGVLTVFYYDEGGLLFAMDRGGSMYYVATDQVGTPHVVADSNGTVVKVLEYDSFGNRLSDSSPSFDLPIGFAGGLEDSTTGLVRFGYRDFDQASGRWMARDPVLYDGGQANLYIYVSNDPVSLRDPLGLLCSGFSVYGVVGGGAEVCCNNKGVCSICFEAGTGSGGSATVAGSGGPKPNTTHATGSNLKIQLEEGCGPVKAAPLNCTYNYKCGWNCDPQIKLGPINYGKDGFSWGWAPEGPSGSGLKCGVQGKVALESCIQFNSPL